MRARRQHPVHPGTGICRTPSPENHGTGTGFQREFVAQQRGQLGAADHDVAPGEERVERGNAQLSGDRFQGFDGDQGHCSVHVGSLAEEPVPHNALARCQLGLFGINGGDVRGTIPGTAKVRMARRDEQVLDADVVPVANRHPPTLTVLPHARQRWQDGGMPIEVRPATHFPDVQEVLGPKRPDANVCWCLSYRIPSKENLALRGTERGERVKELVAADPPPGVLAYDGGTPVGWAAVHPRRDTTFARNRKIPHVDDADVWSVWCIRVRPGHRGNGISHHLLAGAVDMARSYNAPAIEGYPVDNQGSKVDLTMAYVGTRKLFEEAGFSKAGDTDSVLNGFPRVLMRLDLR